MYLIATQRFKDIFGASQTVVNSQLWRFHRSHSGALSFRQPISEARCPQSRQLFPKSNRFWWGRFRDRHVNGLSQKKALKNIMQKKRNDLRQGRICYDADQYQILNSNQVFEATKRTHSIWINKFIQNYSKTCNNKRAIQLSCKLHNNNSFGVEKWCIQQMMTCKLSLKSTSVG